MFTQDSCFELLKRFTGIQPTFNAAGNPEVCIGEHYHIAAILVNGSRPMVEYGPKIQVALGTGGGNQPKGSSSDEIEIGHLILHVLNDIKTKMYHNRQEVLDAFQICARKLGPVETEGEAQNINTEKD